MNDRDWQFTIGSLGDPLADIEGWMLPPYPAWVIRDYEEERCRCATAAPCVED